MMVAHHQDLVEVEARICCLMATAPKNEHGEKLTDAVKLNGYPCQAIARVIPYKQRAAGREDAEIVIDADNWEELSDAERDALIDHELTHFDVKRDDEGHPKSDDCGRPKLAMRQHDHQMGFFDVIAKRHGDASYEVKQAKVFADKCGQTYFGWANPPSGSVEAMPAKMPSGGITSVTLSSGGKSVTLDHGRKEKHYNGGRAEDRRRRNDGRDFSGIQRWEVLMTLTPEQIAELTGDALAEAVAERMEKKPPISRDAPLTTWWLWMPNRDGLNWQWRPRGLDWNAAGMLLAEITRRDWDWNCFNMREAGDKRNRVSASKHMIGGVVNARAGDLPTAVARLFLLVMGKEDEACR